MPGRLFLPLMIPSGLQNLVLSFSLKSQDPEDSFLFQPFKPTVFTLMKASINIFFLTVSPSVPLFFNIFYKKTVRLILLRLNKYFVWFAMISLIKCKPCTCHIGSLSVLGSPCSLRLVYEFSCRAKQPIGWIFSLGLGAQDGFFFFKVKKVWWWIFVWKESSS